jgi:hypothetical protein
MNLKQKTYFTEGNHKKKKLLGVKQKSSTLQEVKAYLPKN